MDEKGERPLRDRQKFGSPAKPGGYQFLGLRALG